MSVYVQVSVEAEEGIDVPGAGVTGGREPPDVGTGNWTLALLTTKQAISLTPQVLSLFRKCAKIYQLRIFNLKTFRLFPIFFVIKNKNAVDKLMWKELLHLLVPV